MFTQQVNPNKPTHSGSLIPLANSHMGGLDYTVHTLILSWLDTCIHLGLLNDGDS